MGGSGGGRSYSSSTMTIGDRLEQANQRVDRQRYDSEVNELLQDALQGLNERDAEDDRDRLDAILGAICGGGDETISLRFGGSVRKHTYVDGFSDVDVIAVLNSSELADLSPQEVLRTFASRLRERLPGVEVEPGTLAVTVRYPDGREIQVLPALSTKTGLRIANTDGRGWSDVVRPDAFARKLTAVNQANGNRVVPVIKQFKGIVETALPATVKLTGYHAESLAIEAFAAYDGPLTSKAMLRHLCRTAVESVITPIADRTGQSLHVDDYLGAANSQARRDLATRLDRLAKRIEDADRRGDAEAWRSLLGCEA
jgi:hypothetical protein